MEEATLGSLTLPRLELLTLPRFILLKLPRLGGDAVAMASVYVDGLNEEGRASADKR